MTSGFFIRDNPFPSHHVSPFVKLERTASTPSGTPEMVSSAKLTQFRKRETTECYKFQKLPMFNAEAIGCFSCMPFRYTWAVWNTIATTAPALLLLSVHSQSVSPNLISLRSRMQKYTIFLRLSNFGVILLSRLLQFLSIVIGRFRTFPYRCFESNSLEISRAQTQMVFNVAHPSYSLGTNFRGKIPFRRQPAQSWTINRNGTAQPSTMQHLRSFGKFSK